MSDEKKKHDFDKLPGEYDENDFSYLPEPHRSNALKFFTEDTGPISPKFAASLGEWIEKFFIENLSYRDAKVVQLRYGLIDGKKHTINEVAELLDMEPEHVEQIEKSTFDEMRRKKFLRRPPNLDNPE